MTTQTQTREDDQMRWIDEDLTAFELEDAYRALEAWCERLGIDPDDEEDVEAAETAEALAEGQHYGADDSEY